MKYNPQKTVKLAEWREAAGLTQDQAAAYFGLTGKKRRDTIGGWERGQSRPGLKHRARFISYLWDKLGLRQNPQLFREIWQETAVTEWSWSPLGSGELPAAPAEPLTPLPLPGPFLAPPRPPYALVGRSELLQTLKQKLGNGRPIALTGLPGAGKTALALALAYDPEILARFPDGVLWAGLGVAPGVFSWLNKWGEALGLTRQEITAAASVSRKAQQLHQAIGRRRILLVIDDAWQLEDALPFQIGGPRCAVLLTTRRPGLARDFAEENVVPVPELDKAGGIVLFTRFAPHVAAAMPAAVASLVTAVGGLPLALKLMARYARKHAESEPASLQKALQQLRDEKTRLTLAQPQRPAHPHPSLLPAAALSLSAVLQTSVAALEEPVRQTLQALSIFPPKPNTFSAAAAREICAADEVSLAALVDYGLLEPGGDGRYTLHQAIADFAKTAVAQSPAAAGLSTRFAVYYKTILQQARQLYEEGGNRVYQGVNLFDREITNIRAGWQWAAACSPADDSAARLCAAYPLAGGFLLHLRLDPQENLRWQQSALAAARQLADSKLTAQSLANLGLVYRQIGQVTEAIACYREALTFFTGAADRKNQIRVLNNMGTACKTQSDFSQALACHQQALSLARQIGDKEQEGDAVANLGVVYKNLRQYEKAIQYQKEALRLAREMGHRYGEMASLIDLGTAYSEKGEPAQAIEFYREALDKIRVLGEREHEGTVLCNLGEALSQMGEVAQAIVYYRQALEIDTALGNRPGELITRYNLGEVYKTMGEYEAALQFYNESLEIAREVGDKVGVGDALWGSARILAGADEAEAERRAQEAEAVFIRLGDDARAGEIRAWLARFARRQTDWFNLED